MRRMILLAFAGLAIVAATANAGLFRHGCSGSGSSGYSYSYSYSSSGGCYGGSAPFARMRAHRMVFVPLPTAIYAAPQNYGGCVPGVGCPAPIPIPPSLVPDKGSTSLVPDDPDPMTLASNVDYKLYDDPGTNLIPDPGPQPQRLVALNELY